MWALDKNAAMPTDEELKKMLIESTPTEKDDAKSDEKSKMAEKMFPFMIRITYPDILIIKEKVKE